MKFNRFALTLAAVLVVCGVVLLRRNKVVPEATNITPDAVSSVLSAMSASPRLLAADTVKEVSSSQTTTVRGTKAYVLTSNGDFDQSLRLVAEAMGARTVGVRSANSLLIEADEATLARLQADGRFAAVSELLPSAKISPALQAKIAAGEQSVDVTFMTLSPADHRLVQDRLVARGGKILTGCFNEGTTFRARIASELVSEFAACGDVRWMEVFTRPHLMNGRAALAMNVTYLWKDDTWLPAGLTGAGQCVSTSDSGIDLTQIDLTDQVADHKVVEGCFTIDKIGHGTHTAGSIAGTGELWISWFGDKRTDTQNEPTPRGMAWGAKLYAWFCAGKDEEGKDTIRFPNTTAELFRGNKEGIEWPAYIHSASWGSNTSGEYTAECSEIDEYVWKNPEFLPVFAAGNEGEDQLGRIVKSSIGSPASAKNVLAVGATQNLREKTNDGPANGNTDMVASFSSRGPCKDGRVKPDLSAPGLVVLSTWSKDALIESGTDYFGATNYVYDSGTSMACPLAAGAMALVREWLMKEQGFKDEDGKRPTAALMKAIITGGAYCKGSRPNQDQGWGRVYLRETIKPSKPSIKLIDRIPFENGKEFAWEVETTSDEQLDVQLAWVDYPGDPAAEQSEPKLVNDLDLMVYPIGDDEIFYGNGGKSPDRRNNLESIRIASAPARRYLVTVNCRDVKYDHKEGGAAALYIRGAFDPDKVKEFYAIRLVSADGSNTNNYTRLESALNLAQDGDKIEILDAAELRANYVKTNDFSVTLYSTNANPRLTPIVRRYGSDIRIENGSLFFSNFVFQAENTTPVLVFSNGRIQVAGTAVFDDIVSRTPGIWAATNTCLNVVGCLKSGITIDCAVATNEDDRFGVYSCSDDDARESALRLISPNGRDRAGEIDESDKSFKWKDNSPVDSEVAVAYVNGDEPVYFRTLNRLFEDNTSGTNIVLTKSRIGLGFNKEKNLKLSGVQSIVAADGAGEILVYPEGPKGFELGADCELTISNVTFKGYNGEALFCVKGSGAHLTLGGGAKILSAQGIHYGSGAVTVLNGTATMLEGSEIADCSASWSIGETTDAAKGGGVYLNGADCKLELFGGDISDTTARACSITGCSADGFGGGVYVGSGAEVEIKGAVVINDCLGDGGKANNLYFNNNISDPKFTIKGETSGRIGLNFAKKSKGGYGNSESNLFAAVDGPLSDAKATAFCFVNDTNSGLRGDVSEDGKALLWTSVIEGRTERESMDVAQIPQNNYTNYFATLSEAFAAVKNDDDVRIELLQNTSITDTIAVAGSVMLTSVEGEGQRLITSTNGNFKIGTGSSLTLEQIAVTGKPASKNRYFDVCGGTLSLLKGATLQRIEGKGDRASGAIAVSKLGTFSMESGATINCCTNTFVLEDNATGVGAGLLVDKGVAYLRGGTISGCQAYRAAGVFVGNEGKAYVSGDLAITNNFATSTRKSSNLVIENQGTLYLENTFTGSVGISPGINTDSNIFGRVAADCTLPDGEIAVCAARFFSDINPSIKGLLRFKGDERILVWSSTPEPPDPPEPPVEKWEWEVENHDPKSPLAFKSIDRISDTEWRLVITNRDPYCNYRLLWTDDLKRGFSSTGDWEHAVGPAAESVWVTNIITSGGAWFWRAEATTGTNMVYKKVEE